MADMAPGFSRFYAAGLVGLVGWWMDCDESLDCDCFMAAYDATVGRMLSAF